jgi:hypothetical protein
MEYGVGPCRKQLLLQGLGPVVVQLGHPVYADDREMAWCRTPALSPAASRLFMEVRKKSRDVSSKVGEFVG